MLRAMARSPIDHLASVSLFSACSKKELQAVARASDQVDLAEGRALCEQGSIGREAFIILEGIGGGEAQRQEGGDPRRGDTFGELALLDHGPRTATVTATTPLKVLVIGAREFAGVIDEVPPIAHKLLKSLAALVRELDTKLYG